ncbi:DUF6090 family protein [Litoribaculum gwangyangense]|uniref:Uncharacterized protein n=1 Tax=Litoribaculum gwangyangense TaxID=1130722 RepID=A0ABP9C8S1_9FLAO
MEKNKIGKYLKYAIGEIILVVLGILIALQINNWNETRKDRIKEQLFLHKLSLNLIDDISSLKNILHSDSLLLQDLNILSNEILTVSNPKELSFVNNSRYKYFKFSANTSLYDNMVSTGQIGLFRNDSIFDELTNYYKKATQMNNGIDESLKNYSREIESFYLKFDHFRDEKELPKKNIEDYRNEPFILNSLYGKYNLLTFQIRNYNSLLTDCKSLLTIVESEIEKK